MKKKKQVAQVGSSVALKCRPTGASKNDAMGGIMFKLMGVILHGVGAAWGATWTNNQSSPATSTATTNMVRCSIQLTYCQLKI